MTNRAEWSPDWPFSTSDEYEALMITECPCDCGCGQLTEDGELCIVCRTGIHNADQE